MLAVTFLGSGGSFFFGWAKPVPVDPRFFKDGQRGMAWVRVRGTAHQLRAGVRRRRAHLADVHVERLPARERSGCSSCSTSILGTLNLIPIPPLDGSRVRRRVPAAGDLPAGGRSSTATATSSSWACSCCMIAVPGLCDATFGAGGGRVSMNLLSRAGGSGERGPRSGELRRRRAGSSGGPGGVTAAFPARARRRARRRPSTASTSACSAERPAPRTCSRTGAASCAAARPAAGAARRTRRRCTARRSAWVDEAEAGARRVRQARRVDRGSTTVCSTERGVSASSSATPTACRS